MSTPVSLHLLTETCCHGKQKAIHVYDRGAMTKIQFQFENKNVVVTGGASGIGFEIARHFLQSGAQVAIWDYSQEALDKAQTELGQWKAQLKTQTVNVTNRDQLAQAAATLPKVDILINNAGITKDKSFAKMTGEDWDAVIQVNLTGLFNVTKALLEKFTAPEGKRIINISSVVALYGNLARQTTSLQNLASSV